MAQSAKGLLYTYEDLSSNPRHHAKAEHDSVPLYLQGWKWEERETGWSLEPLTI